MPERPDALAAGPPLASGEGDAWRAIAHVARRLAAKPELEARLGVLATLCCSLFQVGEARYFPIGRNLVDMAERPGKGTAAFLEYVARLGHPIVVRGKELEGLARTANAPPLIADPRWKTFLLAPTLSPGRVAGVLVLADERDRGFDDEALERLAALLPQVASVLDGGVLAEETRYKEAYSRALGDIDMMIASYDVAEILAHGVRTVHDTLDAMEVVVFIVNQDTGALRKTEGCSSGPSAPFSEPVRLEFAQQALASRKSQVTGGAGTVEAAGPQAVVTPIMANNQVYGVLEVLGKRSEKPFHRNEIAFINQVALKLALVIQNTHAYMTINRLNEGLEQKVKERTSQLEKAITSLQETQAQLMQTEKLATIGTLAGGVAHEINNPLSAILANVQLLRLDVVDPEAAESLQMIESGARRCKHIVENLLNYSRQSSSDHRSLSLNQVMNDTLDLLQHQLRHANVDLVLALGELPPVIAVATELGQVFTNLVVNALDALAEKRRPPERGHLTIRTFLEGRSVVASVQDDGGGIDELVLRKIFDPFFTTKQIGKGTGLGLSIAQQIATAFGGRIETLVQPGEGTTFRVVLPVAGHGTGPLGTGPLGEGKR